MKKGKIVLALVFMLVVATVSNTLFAAPTIDTSLTGSLTIIAKGVLNGADVSEATLLQGVEYTLYNVHETVDSIEVAETSAAGKKFIETKTTDANGEVVFSNLALGRYYAKVTAVPVEAHQIPESFLVDIPMTNEAGTDWIYDVQAIPKVRTATGNVTLQLQNADGEPLAGSRFRLEVKTDETDWITCKTLTSDSSGQFTTDSNGQIVLTNIPARYKHYTSKPATYRFVQETTADIGISSGYIVDNQSVSNFVVNADGTVTATNTRTNTETTSNNPTITVVNDMITLTSKINGSDLTVYAGVTDTMTTVLTLELPSQHITSLMTQCEIVETIDAGLLRAADSVKVTGVLRDGNNTVETVATDAYTVTESGQELRVVFTPANVAQYSTLKVEYQLEFNPDKFNESEFDSHLNQDAALWYTKSMRISGTQGGNARIYTSHVQIATCGIVIQKVDKNDSTILLPGAQFKLATSEANAKAGIYLKGTDGQDVLLTTDSDGKASYYGLAPETNGNSRSYYLVEVKAPTYTVEQDGVAVEKEYSLLKSPVQIWASLGSDISIVTIKNAKKIVLPATGGIGIAIFGIAGISVMAMAIISSKKQQVKE